MHLKSQITVNASPVAAWRVIGECFHYIADWAEPIVASECAADIAPAGAPAVGAVRACVVAGFGPVKPGRVMERLLAFDRERMYLTYEAVAGLPSFLGRAVNRLSVHAHGHGQCVVEQDATLVLQGPARLFGLVIRWQLSRQIALVLGDLRHMIEHGRPSPRKVAATGRRALLRSSRDSG